MIPQLRFNTLPFNKHEQWKSSTIGNHFQLKNGYSFLSSTYDANGIFNVLTISNVQGDRFVNTNKCAKVQELPRNIQAHQVLSPDDILISLTGNVGRVSLNAGCNNLLSQRVGLVAPLDSSIIPEFLFYILKTGKFEVAMINSGQGGAQPNIGKGDVESFAFYFPSLTEQKKIAEFFTLLDRRIEKQQEKVAALREQKKGLQQKIFSRELVFKDDNGNNYPEWEEVKLGDVADIIMGQSPSSSNYTTNPTDMVLIQGNADMKNGNIVPRVFTKEITKSCTVGDIIMSVRAPVGALAITDIEACLGRGVCAIRANDYVYHHLSYLNDSLGWDNISQGSTFQAVSSADVKQLIIPFPSQLEQHQLSLLMSSINKKIKNEETKLALLKEQKQGYMQRMFV